MDRIKELDGLRGLSAIVILAFHLRAGGAFPMGWAAVDLFFVLSGFLITSIILKHHGSPGFLKAFCLRRGLRIWPPYYLALGLLVVIDYFLADRLPLNYLPSFLTFTQGLPWLSSPETAAPGYFGHTWMLAMEEQFYLVWPLLICLLGRRSVVALSFMFLAISVLGRPAGFPPQLLASRCDGFACGAILASTLANPEFVVKYSKKLRLAFACGSLAFLAYIIERELGPTFGLRSIPGSTVLALNLMFACIVGLIILARDAAVLQPLRSRLLNHLGQISYGLYLYHALAYFLVFVTARRFGWGESLARDAIALAITWLAAVCSWRFLERPMLRLKDRFPYDSGTNRPDREPRTTLAAITTS